jgi:hypothetical protein
VNNDPTPALPTAADFISEIGFLISNGTRYQPALETTLQNYQL